MKQPLTTFLRLLLLALALGTGYTSWGQTTYTQIALTGFNQDVIAEGTGSALTLTTYDVDGAVGTGYDFMSANYINPSGATNPNPNPIPNNGLITSIASGTTGLTFQMAGFAASNVLRVPATGNTGTGTGAGADAGTVTFVTPSPASTVYALVTGGGGALTNVTATITFTDGTTQAFTGLAISDWFTPGTATVAYRGFGRVARTVASAIDAGSSSTVTPYLYQLAFSIATANVTKPIASITFGKNTTAVGVIDLFAVTTATIPVCSAPPSNLSTTATTTSGGTTALTSACSFTSIYLAVTGLPSTATAGYTYQWQSSTTSATTGFTNISGATSSTYTATGQTATTYYRLVVTCLYDGTTGGTGVPSTAVQITQNPATSCYCIPTHSSTSTIYTSVTTVTLPGDGGVTLTNSPGLLNTTTPAYYAIYPASTTTTSLSLNGSYTLTVAAIANQRISAWIDYDQNGSLDANEFYILRNASGAVYSTTATNLTATIVPPPNALLGPTRLRIRSDYFSNTVLNTATNACATTVYGEALDYTVSLTGTACSGTPGAATISSSATAACFLTSFVLSSVGPAGVSGLTFQWQSSPAGAGTFTNIAGATANTYTVTGQSVATDYRLLVTCPASSASTPSNVVTVTQNLYTTCYCTPTYASGGTGDIIARVRLGTLDNATTGNASPYYRDYSSAQTGTTPTLQIPTLYAGASAVLTLNFGTDSNQYNGVWIDFNQNGALETSEFFTSATNAGASGTATVTITVPNTGVVAGNTKMRIRGGDDNQPTSAQSCGASGSNYGEAEDYLVNIVATPCAGTLPALTATASATAACFGSGVTLTATGLAPGTVNVAYQWQSRTGTAAFADITGATTNPYTVTTQRVATDYQLVATCAASASTVTSNIVSVSQTPYLSCYCTPVSTGTNEYIKSVTLPGTPGFTNASGANSTNGFGDYTATAGLTTTLMAGTTYSGTNGVSVTVRSNASGSQGAMWIDYDHSGTFDANEYTLIGGSSLTATDVTFTGVTLAVPATALPGQTRVRVRWRNSAFTSADACTSGATAWYGETEDYLISICTPTTATFSYGSTATFCVSGTTNPTVVLASGATAGTFSSTTGLTLDATTGTITLSSSTPGAYTVTNTVAGTCGSSSTLQVTINAAPTAGFSYGNGPYCVSGATNPAVVLTSGATAGTFSSTAGLTIDATTGTITLSSSTPGAYTVTNTVAAANGCVQVTATASITLNAAPTAGFSYPATTICAGSTATLTPTTTAGATVGTYSLPTATGLTLNPNGVVTVAASAAAGTYTVTNTVAAANGCAQVTATASFTITPQTTATFSYSGSPFCTTAAAATPAITGTAGGTFSSATGLAINATTGVIAPGSSTAGTYTVTYTVGGLCPSSSTQSVTITAPQTAGFSYPTTVACAGTPTTKTPTMAAGATPGTFSLPTTTGLSVNATTGVVTVGATAPAGTYIVTNTLAASGGCAAVTSTASFTITPQTTATFNYPASPYCVSGAANPTPTITGTTGGTFSSTTGLSLNATTGVITLSSSTSGTYIVTYTVPTTGGQCGSTGTSSVTINAAPTAGFTYPSATICAGTSTTVTPTLTSGATSGTFSLPAATGLAVNATTGVVTVSASAAAGMYTVTNTVTSGSCATVVGTGSFTISSQATATFSYPGSPFCTSGATNPTPSITGTAGGTFSSTTGLSLNATTGVITLSSSTAGTYTVTYTVAGACGSSSTQSIVINTPPTAGFSYGAGPYCVSGATNPAPTPATGATAGTFTSTTGLTIAANGTITLSSSTPGIYTVTNTVAAANGCAAVTSTASVIINAAPTAGFTYGTGPYCVSGATNPTAALTTGATAGTFTSTAGLTLAPNGAITLSSSTPGTYTVTNTVAAANGCAAVTSTASIIINAAPIAGFSYPTTTACAGTATTKVPTMSTGATTGTFSLPATTGLTVDATTGIVTIASTAAAGAYTVTNTVAAANGCAAVTSTASFTITPQTTATFNYPASPYCVSGAANPAPTITGTTGGTFSSTTGLSLNATTGAITLSSSTPGAYTVTYTVPTTGGQCGSTGTSSVTINAAPTAGFTYPSATICAGASTTVTPTLTSGATSGTFSLPAATGLAVNATTGVVTVSASAAAGMYTVTNTVTSGSCATVIGTGSFTISSQATATFSYPGAPFCTSGATNPTPSITGTAGGTFSSTTGLSINATTGVITLSSSAAGTYTVTYAVSGACGSSSTQSIIINTPPTAGFSFPTTTICAGSSTTLTPTPATGATAGTFSLPATTGLAINATTGVVTVSGAAAGIYTVTNTVTSGGCATVTSTATFTITPQTTATFSYSGSPFCTTAANPTPTITGTAGGTFSSTTGLTINATTGAITLGSSTPGTYTITYSVAGSCPSNSTQSVTITAPQTASFSYPTTANCAGTAATLTPTLTTGATAGTYSLPTATGLSINATTGAITVGATAPAGIYTVTNTVAASGGCAGTTSTASFTITPQTTATFSYSGSPFCTTGTNPTPTITGTAGGTFSSTSGLSINATTGAITLSSSTAGTYVVTYTVAGTCGSSSTQSVTITAPQTAGFSYATPASGTACAGGNGNFAAVLATGATAGTFSVSPIGVSVNATTGALSLAGAAAGTYTVTNTVAASGGCAASTSTATFTVNPLPATPVLTPSGTAATGITLTSSATTGNQFYLNGVAVSGATGQTYLVNSGTKNGAYTVVATSAAGCASATSAAVNVTVTATAGATATTSLTVYPNPTRDGLLTLELSGYREAVALRLTNALGQVVYTGEVSGSALTQKQALNLSELATGVYVLQARTASGEVQTRRIVRE
ncbi:MAG: beta strand repeat-containing protein [Janthinobacterium lividum]